MSETETSDVATTSTESDCSSNAAKHAARKPCVPSMRVETMSTTVTSPLDVIAVSGDSRAAISAADIFEMT